MIAKEILLVRLLLNLAIWIFELIKMISLNIKWKKFIEFLQNKFFFSDKYDVLINDLYDEDILDDNDIDVIQNNKDKNKDDFER